MTSMRHLIPYVGSAYLVFLGWYGARMFGADWRRDLLVAALGTYAVVAVCAHLFERWVRARIDAVDPRDVDALRLDDPEFDEFLADRPRVHERADWGWRAVDAATGIALAFYPPLAYTLWRYRELEGSTPVDGMAIALMLAGTAAYIVWRRHRIRTYRCPRCAGPPARLAGERIRFSCARCGVCWRLGQPVIGDGAARAPSSRGDVAGPSIHTPEA